MSSRIPKRLWPGTQGQGSLIVTFGCFGSGTGGTGAVRFGRGVSAAAGTFSVLCAGGLLLTGNVRVHSRGSLIWCQAVAGMAVAGLT